MRTLLCCAALIASLAAASPAAALLLTVNSAADPGDGVCNPAQCTLREALSTPLPPDDFSITIVFAIPGAGPHVIALGSVLPTIDRDIRIDGFTQPGSTPPDLNTGFGYAPQIELDGAAIPDGGEVHGLRLAPQNFANPTVTGLAFGNFSRPAGDGAAIRIDGAAVNIGGARVEANFIGMSASGAQARPNDIGIRVTAAEDSTIVGNVIAGNRVGILGNGRGDQFGMRIAGNRIGTTPDGNGALPNTEDGIRIVSGCAAPATEFSISGNLIAGNTRDGVHLVGESAACNLLTGDFPQIVANRIGRAANGAALGNGRHGLLVGLLATRTLTVGSPLDSDFPEDENTIASSGGAGIAVLDGAGGVLIRQNTFVDNTGLPIDLGNDGATTNDPGDADTGANRKLNTPALSAARSVGGETTLRYRVAADAAHASYPLRVDFYRVSDGSAVYVDTDFYDVPNAQKSISLPIQPQFDIVAMASDADGNSSEFSRAARRVLFADGFD
ncbi:right-handed parallel beta-helix repeat-containing protein [Chiayiivirga flava]|uniref:CSLREA domain-containing protein n=1 Tax=Chiayiivirga flava TaxID=659595 RepID=A0A7W8D362_9GAMM|nr:right-handed parallel beta-helix repeat-containing protein [Chiayiivirga flava]MBB5207103.1 CSLREA domain-containing protein [Chiayiivirga flava]